MKKKYVKVLESVNDFANIYDYSYFNLLNENTETETKVIANVKDYNNGITETSPVRSLILNESGDYKFVTLSKGSIEPIK